MKRVIALADRSAMPALKLLAAANVLFLISFAVMLALATGEARVVVGKEHGGALDAVHLDAVEALTVG